MIPYLFPGERCPDVMRVVAGGHHAWPAQQRTLRRAPGESDNAFHVRAQREATEFWGNFHFACPIHIECVYSVPDDPSYFDDERANTRRVLLRIMQDSSDTPEMRLAAVVAFIRIFGVAAVR